MRTIAVSRLALSGRNQRGAVAVHVAATGLAVASCLTLLEGVSSLLIDLDVSSWQAHAVAGGIGLIGVLLMHQRATRFRRAASLTPAEALSQLCGDLGLHPEGEGRHGALGVLVPPRVPQ